MALAQSRFALGGVSELLRAELQSRTSATTVDVGRPQTASTTDGPKLNLFLYQIEIDPHLRNQPLDEGQATPLWLVLHYLLTAFDIGRDSDSAAAHRLLSEGLLALQETSLMQPAVAELSDNPQPLKVTLEATDVELVANIMQGPDEPYRLSAAFQIRPVLLATATPPAYAPLVLSVGPPTDEGVAVIPALAPVAHRLVPEEFEAGDSVSLHGEDLSEAVELCFGSTCLSVRAVPAGRAEVTIPTDTGLSPGAYPVSAVRLTPHGRRLASNAVLGVLRPRVATASAGALVDEGGGLFSGSLTITGDHLGTAADSIFVAFYREGAVAMMVEGAGTSTQNSVTASVPSTQPLRGARYRIILRANGVQARHMPEVDWS